MKIPRKLKLGVENSTVSVIRATSGDLQSLLPLQEAFTQSQIKLMPDRYLERGRDILLRFLQDRLSDSSVAIFVATCCNEYLGFVSIVINRDETPFSSPTTIAHLEQILVTTEARGRGIGKELLEAACAWAQAQGATRIDLDVLNVNEKALNVYLKAGFIPISYRLSYAFV
jgi:ribosomal protein S18 acetylase RimI-like enzyme